MFDKRAYLGGMGVLALVLVVGARQIAAAPAATAPVTSGPVPAVEGPRGKAMLVRATPVTELPTPAPASIASPTPAPAGSLASLAQAMAKASKGLKVVGGQVSVSEMEQAMDGLASTSGGLAPLAMDAPEGTADLRQMVALSLSQTGLLAGRLRDEAGALSPEERVRAMGEMGVLSLDVAQAIDEVQGAGPGTSVEQRQGMEAHMQQLLGAMRSIADRYRAGQPNPPGR